MKVKNISEGTTAVRTKYGIILIPAGETKELQESSLLTKLHSSLVVLKDEVNPDSDKSENASVDTLVKASTDVEDTNTKKVSDDKDEDVTGNENSSTDQSKVNSSSPKEELEAKLKSLKASWKRTRRVVAKEQIAKEIKELEKRLETLK